MADNEYSNPSTGSTAYIKTIINVLAEAVPLELKIRELRSRARKEDWEVCRRYQTELDKKCAALADLPETKRAVLSEVDKINEYIAMLRNWMADIRLVKEQYVASEIPAGSSTSRAHVMLRDLQDLNTRIEILEHRLGKYRDVATVSQAWRHAQPPESFPAMEFDPPTNFKDLSRDASSELEEGEIRETSKPSLPKDISSDLLQQTRQFRDSRSAHSAALDRVDQKSKAILNAASMFCERLRGVDIPACSDMVLSIVGSEEVATMLQEEISATYVAERVELFLLKVNHEAIVYGNVWSHLQNTLALTRVKGW